MKTRVITKRREGIAKIPSVIFQPAGLVSAPTIGRYYALPEQRIGLCYATEPEWRFAGALGEPDVVMRPGQVRSLTELEVVLCPEA